MRLFVECGGQCFMRPEKLKFPVCREPCRISAAGVVAANRRARLTKKYPDVVAETERLINELRLTKKARGGAPGGQGGQAGTPGGRGGPPGGAW